MKKKKNFYGLMIGIIFMLGVEGIFENEVLILITV